MIAEQGDGGMLDCPDRIVVSPGYGSFAHHPPDVVTAEAEIVRPGQVLGELRTSNGARPVAAPFDAIVMAYLVRDGERVRPGRPLVHLRAL